MRSPLRRRDEIATFEVAAETLGECGDHALFCFDKPDFWAPAARVAAAAYALGRDGSYRIHAAAVAGLPCPGRARTVLIRACEGGLVATTLKLARDALGKECAKIGGEILELRTHHQNQDA